MGVMGMAVGSSLMQTYAQNKALEAQSRANLQTARNYITSMNFSLQNLEQERLDAFEATIAELEKINLQGNRQESTVDAAVNEGLSGGGRTADLLKRSARADTNRALSASKANYQKKSNEIDLNKEAALRNARNAVASIQDVQKPSILSTLMSLGTNYYQAKGTLESISGIRQKAGVDKYYDVPQYVKYDNGVNYDNLFGDELMDNTLNQFSFSQINPYKYATGKGGYF